MKKIFKFFTALITASIFLPQHVAAQAPEKMSYQAVIRNSSDELVKNSQIGMQISILQGSANGAAVYVEKQTPITNINGLVSIEIGAGIVVSGDFAAIDWANGAYFIKTETDPSGGTSYSITVTNQLLSVPYALHAKTAETVKGGIAEIDPVFTAWDKDYADLINKPTAISDFTMDANNQNISNLANPVNAQDATTKAYVDALLARLDKLELIESYFTDIRDGNSYKFVKIGNQVWMAENLKYLPSVVGPATSSETDPYYYVYDYDGIDVAAAKATDNYKTYGVLYNWTAAMNFAGGSDANPSGVQGVCPCGWHLPSDAEWKQLEMHLGMPEDAANTAGWRGTDEGGKLKDTTTTHWNSPNEGATNESGFTALPGGNSYSGSFEGIGNNGVWWSTTELYGTIAWYRGMNYNSSKVDRYTYPKSAGYSVRCVRD
mgnify:CR=1 FL=1